MIVQWDDVRALDGHSPSASSGGCITLHAGFDARWQMLDAPERFAEWAALVANRFPGHAQWVTIAEPNGWAVERYSGGRRWLETKPLLRALDHQLAAHVLAADVIRQLAATTSTTADVELPLVEHDPYEFSRLLADVLRARADGVDRGDIGPFLANRRAEYERTHPPKTPLARVRRRLAASVLPLDQALPRAIAAVYETPLVTT